MANEKSDPHVLHMLLEMLHVHNTQLSTMEDSDELRKELLGDNLVAIRIIETILYGKHERSLN